MNQFSEYKLSRLMLGTVQFGMKYGIANKIGQPSEEAVRDIIECAYEGGVNCLDTAAAYGDSEKVVGSVLADLGISDKMVIETKIASIDPDLPGSKADEIIEESIITSLKRLKLDVLPICVFHQEDNFRQYAESLYKMRLKGLVRHIGVSVVTPEGAVDAITSGICEVIQAPQNILDTRFIRCGVILQAKENNVCIFSRSVYLQGLLLMSYEDIPDGLLEVVPFLKSLKTLAHDAGMELNELVFRYMLTVDGTTCVLVGVDSLDQMKENLCIAEKGPLEQTLMECIADIIPVLPDYLVSPVHWRIYDD